MGRIPKQYDTRGLSALVTRHLLSTACASTSVQELLLTSKKNSTFKASSSSCIGRLGRFHGGAQGRIRDGFWVEIAVTYRRWSALGRARACAGKPRRCGESWKCTSIGRLLCCPNIELVGVS